MAWPNHDIFYLDQDICLSYSLSAPGYLSIIFFVYTKKFVNYIFRLHHAEELLSYSLSISGYLSIIFFVCTRRFVYHILCLHQEIFQSHSLFISGVCLSYSLSILGLLSAILLMQAIFLILSLHVSFTIFQRHKIVHVVMPLLIALLLDQGCIEGHLQLGAKIKLRQIAKSCFYFCYFSS